MQGTAPLHSALVSKADRRARKQANKERAQEARYAAWRRQRRQRVAARVIAVALVAALVGGVAAAVFAGGDSGPSTAPTVTTEPAPTTTLPAELAAIECSSEPPESAGTEKPAFEAPPDTVIEPESAYRATIGTSCGDLVVEMDPSAEGVSEAGVNNFVFLAREGFYDGLPFHRVVSDFVIQGGDPSGDGTGGPGYQFGSAEDVPEAEAPYALGDLVYANSGSDPSTSGSQFFVVTGPNGTQLPNDFIKFGTVVEGLEVAQRIEAFEAPGTQAPSRPVFITSVSVEEV